MKLGRRIKKEASQLINAKSLDVTPKAVLRTLPKAVYHSLTILSRKMFRRYKSAP